MLSEQFEASRRRQSTPRCAVTESAELTAEGIWLVVAGGVCYTVGTVFLIFDWRICFFHSVRDLLVIIGSGCRFLVIVNDVILMSS